MTRPTVVALLLVLLTPFAVRADDSTEFFEKKVRPILVQHCYRCHSAATKSPKGGLRLDSRAALLKGGDSGPALVPGSPEKSRLVEAVGYRNSDVQMPPKGKLPNAAIADLSAWVKRGAPWPASATTTAAVPAIRAFDLQARKRSHWAWQPVRPQAPPAVRDSAWPLQPADRFILARLAEKGLCPAPPADPRTWLRRVTFDLTGLPPTPAEIDAFLKDKSPDAHARVVDRLLASPAYGERWGRHWLDLVRYAESLGHEQDPPIANAHQYRDYVVRAFNADLPYNQFVTEQLAGDLLKQPRQNPTAGFNESILGTGFWLLGEEVHSPVDIRQDQADRFDNRIDVFGKTFLGLTIACARCHDHKFDAIAQKDYYSLFAVIESASPRQVRFDTLERERAVAAELAQQRHRGTRALQKALADAARPAVGRLAEYLLAVRAAWPDLDNRTQLNRVAAESSLSPELLAQWAAAVRAAADDPAHPLWAWAAVAADPRKEPNARLPILARPASRAAGAEVVIDYATSRPADWLPDGAAFGPRPVRAGELLPSDAPRFAERGAAVYDRAWDRLTLAPGTELITGALGKYVRAGRTLCTPSFRVSAGPVFYLVKGAGTVYAAVDAHTAIFGPLHGQLVQGIPAAAGFRWVRHDLSAYRGHLVHVEFTAAPGSDFAVARVVQAEHSPALPEAPDPLWSALIAGGGSGSPEALAERCRQAFADLIAHLESGELADDARLANWLLGQPRLLSAANPRAARELARVVESLGKQRARLVDRLPCESRLAPALLDGSGVDEHVFLRGSPRVLGPSVPRRFLEALAGPKPLLVSHGSGRLELARQLTDPVRNPLIARVMVNRIWHHLFGRGIVASVDNFGVLGEAPTHPKLLDFLADRFVKDGWSVKRLIRELVLTRTYAMSSREEPAAEKADPQDLLLHRMRLRRLEGEAIRDAILSVSGRLDTRMGGPSVPIYLTPFLDGRGRPGSGPLDGAGRRSLYLAVRRNFLSPFLLAFDTPIPFSTVGRRQVSNVPAQSLILLNDPFVHQQAALWAKRVLARPGSPAERIVRMYVSAFGRSPTGEEQAACREFLKKQAQLRGASAESVVVWADLAHVLFNVKEFIFLR